jgi:hypothetical protein
MPISVFAAFQSIPAYFILLSWTVNEPSVWTLIGFFLVAVVCEALAFLLSVFAIFALGLKNCCPCLVKEADFGGARLRSSIFVFSFLTLLHLPPWAFSIYETVGYHERSDSMWITLVVMMAVLALVAISLGYLIWRIFKSGRFSTPFQGTRQDLLRRELNKKKDAERNALFEA